MTKVLIIDDEADVCTLLSNLLRNINMKTSCVHSLTEASALLPLIEPDIIFLDNHLPDGMGMDYIPYLKEHFATAKLIMITAYDNISDRNKAVESGIDRFLAKPFTRESIYQALGLLTT
jgi:two-component system OmpR family response regulator